MTLDAYVEETRYAQRRLEEALRPVDERLYQWGRWARRNNANIGWPRRTLLGRLIDEGPTGAAHQAPPPVTMPEPIAEVDAAVSKLGGIRGKVLQIAYLYHPNLPPDVQRRKLNMSRHRWKRMLGEARVTVACMLGYEV